MTDTKLTILIVNFNTADFIGLALYALERLTHYSYEVRIIDNGSLARDFRRLKRICSRYPNCHLIRRDTDLRGSMAHGSALNELVGQVTTPWFSVLDSDAVWLHKGWDRVLISRLGERVKVIGSQAPPPKPQDFPLMFAVLFETAAFKKLNIDFKPTDIAKNLDTGWQLRGKYQSAGFDGALLEARNTRTYREGPFRAVVCMEYYLPGVAGVFASHFGRGSSLGAAKYIGRGAANIPVFGRYFLRIRGILEKRRWISIARRIVDQQYDHA